MSLQASTPNTIPIPSIVPTSKTKSKSTYIDSDADGWGFDNDPHEWDNQTILEWLYHLDEDLEDNYRDDFEDQEITGENFTRSQLGSEHWCQERLRMHREEAAAFSAAVRVRLTKWEDHRRNKSKNESQQVPLEDLFKPIFTMTVPNTASTPNVDPTLRAGGLLILDSMSGVDNMASIGAAGSSSEMGDMDSIGTSSMTSAINSEMGGGMGTLSENAKNKKKTVSKKKSVSKKKKKKSSKKTAEKKSLKKGKGGMVMSGYGMPMPQQAHGMGGMSGTGPRSRRRGTSRMSGTSPSKVPKPISKSKTTAVRRRSSIGAIHPELKVEEMEMKGDDQKQQEAVEFAEEGAGFNESTDEEADGMIGGIIDFDNEEAC